MSSPRSSSSGSWVLHRPFNLVNNSRSSFCVVMVVLACLVSTVLARSAASTSKADGASGYGLQLALASATALVVGYWMSTTSNEFSSASTIKKDGHAIGADGYPLVNKDKNMTWREDGGVSKLVPLNYVKRDNLKKYTKAEVAKRNTKDEAWIIINELVYDVTNFVSKHPGGKLVILDWAGKDCTDAFENYHQAFVYKKWLPPLLIGQVTDIKVPDHVKDFRALRQEMLRLGLYETNNQFYLKYYVWYTFLGAVALWLSVSCESTAAHMAGACMMGMFWQQVAGWGHDIGHSTVTQTCQGDHFVGSTIGCIVMGISTGWWRHSHNIHHVTCNSVHHDPDCQPMPVLAYAKDFVERPVWSSYHNKLFTFDRVAKLLISYQHFLFIPIMMVARVNLYVQSWILLLLKPNKDSIYTYFRAHEMVCMLLYAAWVTAIAMSYDTYLEGFAWLACSHFASGILHLQIIASHYPMDIFSGDDFSDDWYLLQLRTTTDFNCYDWFRWFYIGLQYQVEHHISPRIPRHNLPIAKEMVRDVCKKHGLPHHDYSFAQAVVKVYYRLKENAYLARASTGKLDYNACTETARDLLNAQG